MANVKKVVGKIKKVVKEILDSAEDIEEYMRGDGDGEVSDYELFDQLFEQIIDKLQQ